MPDSSKILERITAIREVAEKYGMLNKGETIPITEVLDIIKYYEEDGDSEAMDALQAKLVETSSKLSSAYGAVGPLNKRIKKLENGLLEATNRLESMEKMTRVSNMSADLVEFCDEENNAYISETGDALTELPLYFRLRAELGILDAPDS